MNRVRKHCLIKANRERKKKEEKTNKQKTKTYEQKKSPARNSKMFTLVKAIHTAIFFHKSTF